MLFLQVARANIHWVMHIFIIHSQHIKIVYVHRSIFYLILIPYSNFNACPMFVYIIIKYIQKLIITSFEYCFILMISSLSAKQPSRRSSMCTRFESISTKQRQHPCVWPYNCIDAYKLIWRAVSYLHFRAPNPSIHRNTTHEISIESYQLYCFEVFCKPQLKRLKNSLL